MAAHCHAGAYNNRWTIVVDDDIDPTNFNDVIWAMCTRCDPRDQVDIIHGGWSSALDPMCYDTEHDRRNSRVVIDACIPFRRKKTFPKVARASQALDDRLRAKWAKDLPNGFQTRSVAITMSRRYGMREKHSAPQGQPAPADRRRRCRRCRAQCRQCVGAALSGDTAGPNQRTRGLAQL